MVHRMLTLVGDVLRKFCKELEWIKDFEITGNTSIKVWISRFWEWVKDRGFTGFIHDSAVIGKGDNP